MLAKLTPVLLAAFMTIACSANAPKDPNVDLAPDGGMEDETPASVPLDIEPVDMQTSWDRVVVRGRGPAQGLLRVDSPMEGSDTAQLGSTGEFCKEFLLKDGGNTIKLEATDAAGNSSEPVYVDVTRSGEPPETPQPDPGDSPTVQDRTAGATFYGTDDGGDELTLEAGNWADLVDNNPGNLVKFTGSYLNNETIAFKLSKAMTVRQLKITVPPMDGDTCGPQAFDIYVANAPNPEMTAVGDGVNWVPMASVSSSDALEDGGTYSLPVVPVTATHIAIQLTNATCGFYPTNRYGLSEIRVFADGDGAPPPPAVDCENGPPSCACGN